jgi:hypothetical protein
LNITIVLIAEIHILVSVRNHLDLFVLAVVNDGTSERKNNQDQKKRNIMKWMSEHCDLLEEIPDGLQKDPFY